MKCPNCGGRDGVELDLHSEGFSNGEYPVKECSVCGLLWRIKIAEGKPEVDVIKDARPQQINCAT